MSILEQPIYGDFEKGYYGTVTGLITNNNLSTLAGLQSSGTLLDASGTDITFHKFVHKGRILLIPNRPIRHSISWDMIQTQDCVKGKVIEIGGQLYLCRLMTGSRHYYTNNPTVAGGEWDDLFVHFHTSNGGVLSDSDVNSPTEEFTWTQEVVSSDLSSRVLRGRTSISHITSVASNSVNSTRGWRPVLEVL